jgi:hypothetical protein
MKEFTPTWLYVKVHNDTGLCYLGKTTKDPYTYAGSGVYWSTHLEKHGTNVSTTWVQLYTDASLLNEEALFFSKVLNVVKSKEWANLTEENGFTGGKVYDQSTDERRELMSNSTIGKKMPADFGVKVRQRRLGSSVSDTTKDKIKKKLLGVKKPEGHGTKVSLALSGVAKKETHKNRISETLKNKPKITCPHCNKTGGFGMLSWHFDNCREK